MLFVVVLSLAALAAAEPEIQQKVQQVQPNVKEHQQEPIQHELQQQVAREVNTVPFYKQIPQASPLNIYEGNTNSRYFPFYGQMENYPFLPYNYYKNLMSYPYRSNYFLRELNKPETSEEQSKVEYGYDDMYHVRAINHHHLVNNVHDVKQKHILRKVDTEIVNPYSPMSYDKYTNNYQGKGYGDRFYGKSLDQEYIQPYNYYTKGYPFVNQYYGKSLDQEYIQPYNYYNRGYPFVNQYYGKSLDQEYIQPYNNYNRYWDLDYIRNYYGRNLNSEFTTPFPWSLENTRNYYGRNLKSLNNPWRIFSQLDKPVSSRKINFDYVKPVISTDMETDFIHPVMPSSPVVDFITPRASKNLGLNYIKHSSLPNKPAMSAEPIMTKTPVVDFINPTESKTLGINYIKHSPKSLDVNDYITPETVNGEFQPEYISRNLWYHPKTSYPDIYKTLDWETPLNWNDWSLDDVQGRFRRSEPVKGITSAETNIQVHAAGVPVSQHQLIRGAIQQEGLRQDIHLNAQANAQANVLAGPISHPLY